MISRDHQGSMFGMASGQETPLPPIRVFVASDHRLVREALQELLETGGFEVVGETTDGQSVVTLAKQTRAHVILLDISASGDHVAEILRELSAAQVPARTLLLVDSLEREKVVHALKLGAFGVIHKQATHQQLFDSIRCVMAGEYWVGRRNVADIVKALQHETTTGKATQPRRFGLSLRELEVVTLVVAGYSNQEIAERFSISLQTVKHHMSHIFDKTGVSNRLELALFAVNHRLTDGIVPLADTTS